MQGRDGNSTSAASREPRFVDGASSRVAALLIGLHVLVAGFLAVTLSINADEACTLTTISRGPVHAFQRALSYELQPPVYFTTLAAWCSWGEPLLMARLFSLLCTTGLSVLMLLASRRYLPTLNPCWAVLLVAFNPIVLYAATEARCYALVMLISAAWLVLFFDRFLLGVRQRSKSVGLLLLSCVGLFTFYPFGFLLAAGGVTLVLAGPILNPRMLRNVLTRSVSEGGRSRTQEFAGDSEAFALAHASGYWRAVFDYAIVMVGVAVSLVPLAWLIPNQITTHTVENSTPPGVQEVARLVFWHLRNLVLPVTWSWSDAAAPVVWCVAGVLLLRSLRARWTEWRQPTHVSLLLMVGLMSVFFAWFARMVGTPIFAERHLAPIVAPLLLCSLSVLDRIVGRAGLRAALLVLLLFSTSASMSRFGLLSKPGDWRNAADFVMRHEQPSQTILIFRPSSALSFGYHYHGSNVTVPLPIAATGEQYDIRKFVFTDSSVIDAALQKTGSSDRVWVVTERLPEPVAQEFGADLLEAYLVSRYEVELETWLSGSRVRLLRTASSRTDLVVKEDRP